MFFVFLDANVVKNKWRCGTCLLENVTSKTVCTGCLIPKLQVVTSFDQNNNVNDTSSTKNSFGLNKITGWECSTCLVQNAKNVDACVCCGSRNVCEKSQSGFNTLDSKLCNDKQWDCLTCLVSNKPSTLVCVCCNTPKSSTATKNNAPNLLDSFKIINDSKWECSTCLVSNKPDVAFCVCCNSCKPGSLDTSIGTSNSMTFKFGNCDGNPVLSNIKFGNSNQTSFSIPTNPTTQSNLNSKVCPNSIALSTFNFGKPFVSSQENVTKSPFIATISSAISTSSSTFGLFTQFGSVPSTSNSNSLFGGLPNQKNLINGDVSAAVPVSNQNSYPSTLNTGFGTATSTSSTLFLSPILTGADQEKVPLKFSESLLNGNTFAFNSGNQHNSSSLFQFGLNRSENTETVDVASPFNPPTEKYGCRF